MHGCLRLSYSRLCTDYPRWDGRIFGEFTGERVGHDRAQQDRTATILVKGEVATGEGRLAWKVSGMKEILQPASICDARAL
ncbi:MAG TPA: hypothetical protein VH477_16060 [Bryobacteraceae bacterium]